MNEIDEVLRELDVLLKNPDIGAALAEKGVNTSLAMAAVEGLRAYLAGEKARALEEMETFVEEVKARLALGASSN